MPAPLGLIVVTWIEIEFAKGVEDAELFASFDIFCQGRGDCLALGLVLARPARFFDQPVIECEIGGHV